MIKSTGDKKSKFWPCSRTKLRFVHASISLVSLAVCYICLISFEGLLLIGKPYESPIIAILIISEIIKCIANRKYLHVIPQMKPPVELPVQSQPTVVKVQSPKYVQDTIKSALVLGTSVVFAAAICILFGAPILDGHEQTLALAMQLVIVSILPFVLFIGPDGTIRYLFCDYFKLASKNQTGYLDMIHYNAVFALFGSWASSAVAPLDWDRPWQAYPVPNMCGTLVGLFVGNMYAIAQATYKYHIKKYNVSNKASSLKIN